MNTQETYRIRPAGRLVLTIGRELIQDCQAAIMELVKNAYDADSPDVSIEFSRSDDLQNYSIIISDHGHGMTKDTVVNKWLVPSTADKLERKTSPRGRIMQGRKGIGRYASAILGSELELETVTPDGIKTVVPLNWEEIENAEYLDTVGIRVNTFHTDEPAGTRLTIKGNGEFLEQWTEKQFRTLLFELRKLTPPVDPFCDAPEKKDSFSIHIRIAGFKENDCDEEIVPFPLFDLYDYRIAGKIAPDGTGTLEYSSQKARNIAKENISFDFEKPTGCGELNVDIRVYDREAEAIDSLIRRGLTDVKGNYLGKQQARVLLNEFNGIGVYRNGFRIRPLGNADFDWLKLNEDRIQNPSMRIGSNQAIGLIHIQSEELSGLIEKSGRDGLMENASYENLKTITQSIIRQLEIRRFAYRKKTGLSRSKGKMETRLEDLFSSEPLKREVASRLSVAGVSSETVADIHQIIDKENSEKNKVLEEIRQAVAIYQGQATLGKIINVVLHEARRPLNYFRNQTKNIVYWCTSFVETKDTKYADLINRFAENSVSNTNALSTLFDRLDPLAATRRTKKKDINLKNTIFNALGLFDSTIASHDIHIRYDGPENVLIYGWEQDITAIFTNLIENSIYWMEEKKTARREISIQVVMNNHSLDYIDYRDSGPGIEPSLIDEQLIFEPQFSTKPSGTGLGLAIAGEAAERNNLKLSAIEYPHGAWFRLQNKTEET